MNAIKPYLLLLLLISTTPYCANETTTGEQAAREVLHRTLGSEFSQRFILELSDHNDKPAIETGFDSFTIHTKNNLVKINANTVIGLCRGSYHYLKTQQNSLVSWSGSRIQLPNKLANFHTEISTPYQYRYYFNVVTHGYTTAYWDWPRWEKEIDWMALHGINMPLIPGAHEAILYRVFRKLGLNEEESYAYFSGPAHFPWNRMGNLIAWDGATRLPKSYFDKQIQLNHKVLKRMRALEMHPIIHAFAGFVPPAIKRLYPHENIRELAWGAGLAQKYNGYILSAQSPLFIKIGKLYIEEWEKEFGPNQFYLADSFNEMDAPLPNSEPEALTTLSEYGQKVYQSIISGNPKAIWVMQGWTFPYHKDKQGKRFWTPKRLQALVSNVPDNKLLILDLANEYNYVHWKIEPSWKMYHGFFGKQWIYSFIPNMGGKTSLNGILNVYASIPSLALQYPSKGNLVGFGFAPEGIENNEMIYELLSDIAWQTQAIDLELWQQNYALQRYGLYPPAVKKAYTLLNQSAWGTFTDHPIHRFQLRPYLSPEGVENHATVHDSKTFRKAVWQFLQAHDQLKSNPLYISDALELSAQSLGLAADDLLRKFLSGKPQRNYKLLDEALQILQLIDQLLSDHPTHQLDTWVTLARSWGDNELEKNYYESNAKRLLTTWGGEPVNDYSARVWSGLIRDYYIPRWQQYHQSLQQKIPFDIRQWEEHWITTPYHASPTAPYKNKLTHAKELIEKYNTPNKRL